MKNATPHTLLLRPATLEAPIPHPGAARTVFRRRLARQAALGVAGATGSGIVRLLLWWLRGV